MRQPTPAELEIINLLLPGGGEPLTDRDIVVETIVATDNLVSRSKSKWHKEAFPQLAELIVGLPFTLDHDWDEVEKVIGRVFAARVKKYPTAPDRILNACGEKLSNLQAIKADGGYLTCECDVFIQIDSPAVQAIKLGKLDRVSIGGFDYNDLWCPLCDCSFFNKACAHGAPDPWSDRDDENIAPYYERKDAYDLGEISAVLIPNVPGAGIKCC
jgi:hypothetical protein